MGVPHKSIWNDDRLVSRLGHLWREGYSALQISHRLTGEFNIEISRNAVIGKLNRMGMTGKPRMSHPSRSWALAGQARPPKPRKAGEVQKAKKPPQPKPAPIVVDRSTYDPAGRLTLLELGRDDCRFVTSSGLFCGEPVVEGKSYCPACCAVVFWKPPRPTNASELARSLRRYL